MRRRAVLAALGTSLATPALAQTLLERLTGTVGAGTFVEMATISDNFEITSSNLLLARSQHPQIRAFAEHMVQAHTQSSSELKAIPEAVTRLSTALDERHGDMLEALRRAEDVDRLNRLYVQMQVQAHEEAVELYETYARSGGVPSLQAFAQKYAPEISRHLAMARALQAPG
ncbi:DUF4142 domain-containing protein [Falsiroseomonas sp. HW251]|uniref:DUF4142 domain-containing protein n=1 Tax=Falsiroseomonas sp. HW251 TaxID=3390998 RepID=UPI003D31F1B3